MNSITTVAAGRNITELRKVIEQENKLARSLAWKSLLSFKTAGDALIELKAMVGHGQFRAELMYLRMKPTTAANHMRIARKWASVAHLKSVKEALRLLNRVDDTPPAAAKATPKAPLPAPCSSTTAASVIVDMEIVEPTAPAEVITPRPAMPEDEPPPEPAVKVDSSDPFLSIVQWLPDLSQDQFRELVNIIQTRWIR